MTKKSKGRLPDYEYYVRKQLTEDEIKLLLKNCFKFKKHPRRNYWIVMLTFKYGMRASEVCNLKWKDIDLQRKVMRIRRLKGSDDTVVDLSDGVIQFFYEHRKKNHYNSEYVFLGITNYTKMGRIHLRQIFHELGIMSGLGNHVHPHRLKHSNVTFQREQGMPREDVQKSIGHKNSDNTEKYDHSLNYRRKNYFEKFEKEVGAA
jgi:integrase